jgi:hypothetical protein
MTGARSTRVAVSRGGAAVAMSGIADASTGPSCIHLTNYVRLF